MVIHKDKLDWIQALRGVAVMLVVFSHARYYFMNTPQWQLAETLFRPGAMGVDLFFIISGFIMVYTTRTSDASAAYTIDFAIKRFARIWPVYAIATLLYVLVKEKGPHYFADASNIVIFAKSLLFYPADPSVPLFFGFSLPLGWTLAFEVYFYAVFGISMLFGRLRWAVLFGWMLLTVILIPYALGNHRLNVQAQLHLPFAYLDLITNSIIVDFLAGVAIAHIYLAPALRLNNRIVCQHLLWGGIGLALWCNYTSVAEFHGLNKWGGPLALMVLCMALASKTLELTPPKLLVWFGTISYSLYLIHTIVQFGLSRWLDERGVSGDLWGRVFITSLCSIILAGVSYRYLEVKLAGAVKTGLSRLAHNWLKPPQPPLDAQPATSLLP